MRCEIFSRKRAWRNWKAHLSAFTVVLVAFALAGPTFPTKKAEAAPPANIAMYQGADREKHLTEGARKERQLLVYTSAPVDDYAVIAGAFARPNGIGMARNAPHPHTAALFYDFMLSDAQKLLLERDFVPTSKNVDTKLNKIPIKFVDPRVVLGEGDKWLKLYDEIITKQSKGS